MGTIDGNAKTYRGWIGFVKADVPQRALVASYLEAAKGGKLNLSPAMIDSTVVRVHQHAPGHKKTAAPGRSAARAVGGARSSMWPA